MHPRLAYLKQEIKGTSYKPIQPVHVQFQRIASTRFLKLVNDIKFDNNSFALISSATSGWSIQSLHDKHPGVLVLQSISSEEDRVVSPHTNYALPIGHMLHILPIDRCRLVCTRSSTRSALRKAMLMIEMVSPGTCIVMQIHKHKGDLIHLQRFLQSLKKLITSTIYTGNQRKVVFKDSFCFNHAFIFISIFIEL